MIVVYEQVLAAANLVGFASLFTDSFPKGLLVLACAICFLDWLVPRAIRLWSFHRTGMKETDVRPKPQQRKRKKKRRKRR